MSKAVVSTLLAVFASFSVIGCTTEEGDDTSPTATTACSDYCTTIMSTCSGDNAQYASETECLSSCSGFATTGADGDAAGNTLQCREYHLGVAATDAATHCSHAGADGGGVCID